MNDEIKEIQRFKAVLYGNEICIDIGDNLYGSALIDPSIRWWKHDYWIRINDTPRQKKYAIEVIQKMCEINHFSPDFTERVIYLLKSPALTHIWRYWIEEEHNFPTFKFYLSRFINIFKNEY